MKDFRMRFKTGTVSHVDENSGENITESAIIVTVFENGKNEVAQSYFLQNEMLESQIIDVVNDLLADIQEKRILNLQKPYSAEKWFKNALILTETINTLLPEVKHELYSD